MKKNLSKNDYRDICEGCIVLSIFIYFRQFLQQAFQVLWDIFGPSGYYRVTDTDHLPTPPDSSFNVYWTVKLQKTVEFRKWMLFHCMFGMIFLNFLMFFRHRTANNDITLRCSQPWLGGIGGPVVPAPKPGKSWMGVKLKKSWRWEVWCNPLCYTLVEQETKTHWWWWQ